LTISQNPDNIAWEEVELAVYGDIDSDSDRLVEMISWEDETSSGDPLLDEVKRNFASLADWSKYACPGHKAQSYSFGTLEANLFPPWYFPPQEVLGTALLLPTGKTKEVVMPDFSGG
jgi:hypothetical protein